MKSLFDFMSNYLISIIIIVTLCTTSVVTERDRDSGIRSKFFYKGHTYNIIVTPRYGIHGANITASREDTVSEDTVSTDIIDAYMRQLALENFTCPDPEVMVVAFAPNNIPIELNVTLAVYKEAQHKFHSVLLILENATRVNFLSYARCPKLRALFYDGDATNSFITTYDTIISHYDIAQLRWKYRVTTYWLACQAFNPPMLNAVIAASPRRWAAGVTDLGVGAADIAASAAMIKALNGSCLEESFDHSMKTIDLLPTDFWGFGGFGQNILIDSTIYPIPCGGME